MKAPRVFHITPARSDKNLGKALNDIIRVLPDDSWICQRDIDTVPLDHVSFIKQCEDIAKDGSYQLVGCMTNRLGLHWQIDGGKISDNDSMDYHIKRAKQLSTKHGSKVIEAQKEIAGIMFLFPKSLWVEVGGFKEGALLWGSQFWDNEFYERVKKVNGNIGVAIGIYMWHTYRWGLDPRSKAGKAHLYK